MADTEKLIQDMLNESEEEKSSGSFGPGMVLMILLFVAIVIGAVVYIMFLAPKKKKNTKTSSDTLDLTCKQPICSGPGWSGSVCTTDTCLRNEQLTDSDFAYCPQSINGLNTWAATSDRRTRLYASKVSKKQGAICTRKSSQSDASCTINATVWSEDTPADELKNAICKKVDGTNYYAVNCPCDNCEEMFEDSSSNSKLFSIPIVMPPDWDYTQQFCCPRAILSNEQKTGSENCEPCTEKTLGTVCMDGTRSQFICVQPKKYEKEYKYVLFHNGYENDIYDPKLCAQNKFCSYGRFGNAATCPGFEPKLMDLIVPYAANIQDMNEKTGQAFSDNTLLYALK